MTYPYSLIISMFFRIGMSYEETVKDIQQTFGMFPGFFKNTPKDVLPQMWPLFKKYQIGESIIPKKYREMMMLASAAATKCPYCQTYHREVAKMLGATEQELQELAVVVAGSAFWSNILHVENYDYNTFVKELQQIGEYVSKQK
jgi:AhpD family alkylhydroperoxidase